MDINKEREAFERFKAEKIGIAYDELKTDLDDCKRRFGKRYAGWNFSDDWELWQAAKASVAEGFVLVSAEQLSKWGHMANYAEQYGCPECFESRGYAHTLSCEINEYFAIEAQEPAND